MAYSDDICDCGGKKECNTICCDDCLKELAPIFDLYSELLQLLNDRPEMRTCLKTDESFSKCNLYRFLSDRVELRRAKKL
jgi:hypothetical protein